MEIEQPISRFQKSPPVKILSTSEIDAYSSRSLIDDLFEKFIARSYSLNNFISGHPSYFFQNFSSDFAPSEFSSIFNFLIDKNLVGNYRFSNSRYNDMPHFYRIDIAPKYPLGITDGGKLAESYAHGFCKDPKTAFAKAVGEFLERYFLAIYHKKNFIRSSYKFLTNKTNSVLDLNLLTGFSEEQKKSNPHLQFNNDSVFYWEKVIRISNNQSVYVPAQLVYWLYRLEEAEPHLRERNTSGGGGFFTLEGAILAGLYELIQRDAFFVYWLNRLTPAVIKPETVPNQDFQSLFKESMRYGFEVFCLNVTNDTGVPAFVVMLSDPTGKSPRFSLGAGCNANPSQALSRALEECWSVYEWSRRHVGITDFTLDGNSLPFDKSVDQVGRTKIWNSPLMAKHLEFFITGKQMVFSEINFNYPAKFNSQKEELKFLVKRVESLGKGYEVYYYNASHPILSEIGYYSAKVIVPQLIPLYLHEQNAPLGAAARLKEASKKLGLSPEGPLNPLPHMFS